MKRKLFSIMAIAAIAMTSCKKEEVLDSNQLGDAIIKGNVFANLDLSNDVDGAGLYTAGSLPEKVEGMVVSVEVDTKDWDQTPDNSYTYPKKTYTATTDANGDFTLTIPATEKASNVYVSLGNYYTTQKQYTADGSDLTEEVVVGDGSGQWVEIFSGAALNISVEADVDPAYSTNPYEYGTATLRMNFGVNWVTSGPNNMGFYDDLTNAALIGKTVNFSYNTSYGVDGNGGGNIFPATFTLDPTDNTNALLEVEIPTYSIVSGQSVPIKVNIPSFQGMLKQDNGSGAEETINALWNSQSGTSFYVTNLTAGQIETVGTYSFSLTPN